MKRFTLINAKKFLSMCQALSSSIHDRPLLISIDGRSGSGKTLFSFLLKACLQHASIPVTTIRFDDFWTYTDAYKRLCASNAYQPLQDGIDYTYDWRCFRRNILEPLRNFDPAPIRDSNWMNTLLPEGRDGLTYGGAVIIEGCTTQRRELSNLYDIRMHMDLDLEECVKNAVTRAGPNSAEHEYYVKDWRDIENDYLARHEPEKNAHFRIRNIVSQGGFRFIAGPRPL